MTTEPAPLKSVPLKPIVWTISGADCSGGAGIAADIKTLHALGCEVCHLITANTVQNANKLFAVNAVDYQILEQQYTALKSDKPPNVIKIGLLATRQQVHWLVTILAQLKAENDKLVVVFDPVGSASVGGKFHDFTLDALNDLLPLIDVITPNLMEAQALAKHSTTDAEQLANTIIKLGAAAVVIKGGHLGKLDKQDASEDYCLADIDGERHVFQLSSDKINTDYSHGGGCSFASALAGFLANDHLLRDAFTLTKAFINQGLKCHQDKTGYYGAFEQVAVSTNASDYPKITGSLMARYQALPAFKTLGIARDGKQSLGLYPVVDSLSWLKRLLPLGLEIIQLRLKNLPAAQLEQQIQQAVKFCQQYNTRLFINDYWQLAIKYQAYGVHLGQEDLQDADLAAINKAGLCLGISTHGCYEFLLAQQFQPSYLAIGAIFPTVTKDMTGQIQGVATLAHTLNLATDIPVVAIGGINLERAEQVWQTGVDSLAVVTAITLADNPERVVADFQQLMSIPAGD
ncbi:thiamine phosphate synthase [Thalassotalea sp. ND16A]|uniref:thiamine phosphate synthase n=1 Tax=Thalassotalea sp. ND16A TaxID=1535422 RepID=UPI00051D7EE8|nr:thiamine phosphate synthase [Thalassotalea sp. ND16A]KGJ99350.1 Phosphomethylpyrimidine kinase, Thiamine-phosphate diphosphorylase [Thalassotalea sp. ND16A]